MAKTLIIRGGSVVDPVTGTVEPRDVFIADGKLAEDIPQDDCEVLNAAGCCIAPGFVDSHVHIFEKQAVLSIPADQIGIQQGVLTVVDAGSTGIRDYPFFKKEIIDGNTTDVRFFLNIARSGLCDSLSELADPADLMTAEELGRFQKEHGGHLVGLKVRMSGSVVKEQGLNPLLYGRQLSEKSGLPLMIHIGNAPPNLDEVLDVLQKGDIVTHCFHGKVGGVSHYPRQFRAAAKRGVRFDVGHGAASFSYETVPKVLDIAPVDFTISTDLYSKNFASPVGSLMDTMSKFLPMGYTLPDLVRRVTVLPREVLGLPPVEMSPGGPADLTLFRMVEAPREFIDSEGYHISACRYLRPAATIKQGDVVWSNGL